MCCICMQCNTVLFRFFYFILFYFSFCSLFRASILLLLLYIFVYYSLFVITTSDAFEDRRFFQIEKLKKNIFCVVREKNYFEGKKKLWRNCEKVKKKLNRNLKKKICEKFKLKKNQKKWQKHFISQNQLKFKKCRPVSRSWSLWCFFCWYNVLSRPTETVDSSSTYIFKM